MLIFPIFYYTCSSNDNNDDDDDNKIACTFVVIKWESVKGHSSIAGSGSGTISHHGDSFIHITHEDSFVEAVATTVLASTESKSQSSSSSSSLDTSRIDNQNESKLKPTKPTKRKKSPKIRRTIREVVAESDGKIPLQSLPSSIIHPSPSSSFTTTTTNNNNFQLLYIIDAIYHASTQEETRELFYRKYGEEDSIIQTNNNNNSDTDHDTITITTTSTANPINGIQNDEQLVSSCYCI